MTVFDERANGQEIRLPLGATLLVRLEERPTTGFRWQLVSDGAPTCALVEHHFESPPDKTPGRPGHHSWTFKVARAGRAAIELAARRAWEQDAPPASTFAVSIRAD